MSTSMTQSAFQHLSRQRSSACFADRPGLYLSPISQTRPLAIRSKPAT